MASLSVLAITAVAVTGIPEAQAVDTSGNMAETEPVTVTGEGAGSLTSVSAEESAEQKRQVPEPSQSRRLTIWNSVVRQTSKIYCNEYPAFSFNRKTASKRPKFPFAGPESHLRMSRLA